ncbi:hypothetical protein ACK1KB_05770 [Chryseobacterium sp. TY3]
MKTNIKILTLSIFMLGLAGVFSTAKAQTSNHNEIQGITLKSGDGFGELRNLLKDNFDFNNPTFKEGIINSDVSFSLTPDGKISNVHAKGDCKNVSKEIENVLTHLLYKVDVSNLKTNMIADNYTFPVTVMISQR